MAGMMASVDVEELRSTHRVPRGMDGGNSGKFNGERPEDERNRQDDP